MEPIPPKEQWNRHLQSNRPWVLKGDNANTGGIKKGSTEILIRNYKEEPRKVREFNWREESWAKGYEYQNQ